MEARVGVTESHKEPDRASKSLREPEGARVGVAESHRETER